VDTPKLPAKGPRRHSDGHLRRTSISPNRLPESVSIANRPGLPSKRSNLAGANRSEKAKSPSLGIETSVGLFVSTSKVNGSPTTARAVLDRSTPILRMLAEGSGIGRLASERIDGSMTVFAVVVGFEAP